MVGLGVVRREALPPVHGLTEDELHLAVDAAQILLRPSLQLAPELGVDAQEKGFAGFHEV